MMLSAGAASAGNDSYSIFGLKWGSSPKEAVAKLKTRGFKGFRTVKGKRLEFAKKNAHGIYVRRDRGKRIVARGKLGGERATIQLVFGKNDKLNRIIVATRNWNGTTKHARRMTNLANAMVRGMENRFGRRANKNQPFGFVDTATWPVAPDGSRAQFYVRGTNGFMFFPKDKTGIRIHLSNPRFGGVVDPAPGPNNMIPIGSTAGVPVKTDKAAKTKAGKKDLWDSTDR